MKILIIDNHPIIAKCFAKLLNSRGYETSLEPVNYDTLFSTIRYMDIVRKNGDQPPFIILMNIQLGRWMTEESGINWTKNLLTAYPELKIILVTGFDYPSLYEETKACGAKALLLKSCREEEFFETVERVIHGEEWFPVDQFLPGREVLNQLKSAHRCILQLMADGKKGEDIALITNYSLRSVRNKIKEIRTLFNTNSNTEMISKAISLGVVKANWTDK